jgi:hypothetical protein
MEDKVGAAVPVAMMVGDVKVTVDLKNGRPVPKTEQDRAGAAWYFDQTRPYHEAAHATVTLALGGVVDLITLDSEEARAVGGDAQFAGVVKGGAPKDRPDIFASITVAGIVQDAFIGCPAARPEGDSSAALAASARQGAADWADFQALIPTEAERVQVVRRTHALLLKLQGYVELVAQALQEKGRLTGEDVRALVGAETERRIATGAMEVN